MTGETASERAVTEALMVALSCWNIWDADLPRIKRRIEIMARECAGYPLDVVQAGVRRCARDLPRFPQLSELLSAIADEVRDRNGGLAATMPADRRLEPRRGAPVWRADKLDGLGAELAIRARSDGELDRVLVRLGNAILERHGREPVALPVRVRGAA